MKLICSLAASFIGQQAMGVEATAGFELSGPRGAAPFILEANSDSAVVRAADDVRRDIERVCGIMPVRRTELVGAHTSVVLIGIAGQSALIDSLASSGKLDLKKIKGAWETFAVSVVADPMPGVSSALVIVGSDRRGAIYGVYEISNLIGVSPWSWWADVPIPRKERLEIPLGTKVFGPPSVKYRGIFLNDEDWALQPWAAHTFEKETGNIGPKTYAKIFELLLRLRGNLVWPAMHPSTRAFNHYPENKKLADDYGIVMGSSHAEPMLCNNVDEWTAPPQDFDYVSNRSGILKYWESRVAENGRFENIYTLGIRGVHDSNMLGPRTDEQRVQVLEQVFADQRALIGRYVRSDVEQIPQMFCAYKEVLELYRLGLRVPSDVTIVWPDDNFGYVRSFSDAKEQSRIGGSGVYYHLSYLGHPLSYLWLSTTPPALIWQQMHQSFAYGANRIWVANVGDIKPAEISTEFFLQMAWDIDRWNSNNLPQFLEQWASREFPPAHATQIASIMARYYLLNFQRKPEHLQWWRPRAARRTSDLTDDEIHERLAAFSALRRDSEVVRGALPAEYQDAYFELVHYPVIGSALDNERYFRGERGDLSLAVQADASLKEETRRYNEDIAGGKWRGMMALEPADRDWSSMRIASWEPFVPPSAPKPSPAKKDYLMIDAAEFKLATPRGGCAWTVIPGLGRTGRAVTMLPANRASFELTTLSNAPCLDYAVDVPTAGDATLEIQLLPTHPISGGTLRVAMALDDQPAKLLSLAVDDDEAWNQGVLNGVRRLAAPLHFHSSGTHQIRIFGLDSGVVIDRLVVDFGATVATYFGPNASLRERSP